MAQSTNDNAVEGAKNDGQTHDLREGNKPAVADGLPGAPSAPSTDNASNQAPVPASGDNAAKSKIAKAAGVKPADVIGYNADRQSIVTAQGGKYRYAADGKTLLHVAGPTIEENTGKGEAKEA